MTERKTVAEMLGEFFREAAVLTAVFIPLDRVLLGEPLTLRSLIAILGISGGSLAFGNRGRTKEKAMSDQFIQAIAPVVSLLVLAAVAAIYFVRKERRESQEEKRKHG